MDYYVYKHTNKINGKCYIGQTKNIKWRWYPKGYVYCAKFYRAILKYGWDNFTHEIIKICNENDVDYWESYYIQFYDSINNGYNLDSGGCKNKVQSKETIQKKIEANKHRTYQKGTIPWNKGLKASEETRRKLSEAHKGQNLGKHLSEETIEKIRQKNIGRKISEETRLKLSISHKGKPSNRKGEKATPETIEKLRKSHIGQKCWKKGIKATEEERKRLASLRIGLTPPNTKKVRNIDTQEIFNSLADACKKYNMRVQNLSKVVNGQRQKSGGYRWEFYFEDKEKINEY